MLLLIDGFIYELSHQKRNQCVKISACCIPFYFSFLQTIYLVISNSKSKNIIIFVEGKMTFLETKN